jgi:hypothetical protein
MKNITDRGGISLGNDEHPDSMAMRTTADKRGGGGALPNRHGSIQNAGVLGRSG